VTLNNSAMVETTSYDPYRLQSYSINLMQGASPLLNVGYSYCGSVIPGVSGSCTKNNGNLLKQKITVQNFPSMTKDDEGRDSRTEHSAVVVGLQRELRMGRGECRQVFLLGLAGRHTGGRPVVTHAAAE
jgi:hypothetical protein